MLKIFIVYKLLRFLPLLLYYFLWLFNILLFKFSLSYFQFLSHLIINHQLIFFFSIYLIFCLLFISILPLFRPSLSTIVWLLILHIIIPFIRFWLLVNINLKLFLLIFGNLAVRIETIFLIFLIKIINHILYITKILFRFPSTITFRIILPFNQIL